MSKQASVNESDSLNDNKSNDPSGQGDDQSNKVGDRTTEQVMAENKRKTEEIAGLRSEISEMKDILSEMKEINNPTREERQEIKQLEDTIDTKKAQLQSQKETQPWIGIAQDEALTITERVLMQRQIEDGNYFLEDKAEENGIDVSDKQEFKKFIERMKPYALKYSELSPVRRNQMAYKDWKKDEKKLSDLNEREKKIAEKEMQDKLMREGRGRIPIDKEKEDKYNNARNSRERLSAVVDLVG